MTWKPNDEICDKCGLNITKAKHPANYIGSSFGMFKKLCKYCYEKWSNYFIKIGLEKDYQEIKDKHQGSHSPEFKAEYGKIFMERFTMWLTNDVIPEKVQLT